MTTFSTDPRTVLTREDYATAEATWLAVHYVVAAERAAAPIETMTRDELALAVYHFDTLELGHYQRDALARQAAVVDSYLMAVSV